jgi:hypothetical protein
MLFFLTGRTGTVLYYRFSKFFSATAIILKKVHGYYPCCSTNIRRWMILQQRISFARSLAVT